MSKKIMWIIASAFLVTTTAWAGANYESTVSSCTTLNCAGMTIRGIHQASDPFVIQVYSRKGECLRLDVSSQTENTSMMVLSPSVGSASLIHDTVDLRPIFALDDIPWTGWWTVAISYYRNDDEQGVPDNKLTRFTLEYGRYSHGNPNCSQATETIPLMPAALTAIGSPAP